MAFSKVGNICTFGHIEETMHVGDMNVHYQSCRIALGIPVVKNHSFVLQLVPNSLASPVQARLAVSLI